MAAAAKTIGTIAGAVATVALIGSGIGAALGGTMMLVGVGSASSIAMVAGLVAGVANIGAQALTKPPPARGSLTDVMVEVDPPAPYLMGEGYFAGVPRHFKGYGATLNKVPNPYWWEVRVLSHGGPIEGPITPQFDFAAVDGWYGGFFDYDTKLGAVPDTALVAPYGNPASWTSAHKLSGQACIGGNFKFDKDGERFANGRPPWGAVAKWVKVYDPRQDDTFPGGSGPCRLGDESTYVWSGVPGDPIPAGENPALHAGTYGYGRYQNGKRVMGMGLPVEAIDFEAIAAWANDCSANQWRIFGAVFEGAGISPGQRWNNLRDICIAGGGEPLPLHTGIGFHWDRPRVVLDTVTADDIAGDCDLTAMQTFRERINTIIPEGLNTANWELEKAEPIVGSTYLAEDGEPNTSVFPFNFVKTDDGGTQLGQLAAYRLANGRELYPLELDLMPRLRAYRPGDCLQLTIVDNGDTVIDTPAVMVTRQIDPVTGSITATFIGETAAKHAYALGTSATPPPTPALGMTPRERDELAAAANGLLDKKSQAIVGSYPVGLAGNITQTDNADGTWTIGIPAHERSYGGVFPNVSHVAQDVVIDQSTSAIICYDDPTLADTDPILIVVVPGVGGETAADAYANPSNPYRHFLAYVTTDAQGGTGGTTGGSGPSGSGGWNGDPDYNIP